MQSITKILPRSQIYRFSTLRIIDTSIILPQLQKIQSNLQVLYKIDYDNNLNLKTTLRETEKNINFIKKYLKINGNNKENNTENIFLL